VVPAFYALQDTWTPLKIALICLGANVILNALLILPLAHAGLALATSLSSFLNLVLLSRKLSEAVGEIDVLKNVEALLGNFACSVPMGLVAYLICSVGDWSGTGHSLPKLFLLSAGIVAGIGIYLVCSYWSKNEEMLFLLKMVKERRRR
jgi:putative peptidoglycan lipid II flippase